MRTDSTNLFATLRTSRGMDQPYSRFTPGITIPNFSADPLGTEGEMTPGPDDLNPAVDPDARDEIERIKAKQKEYAKRDDKIVRTVPFGGFDSDPSEEPNPYLFDDIGRGISTELEDMERSGLFEW